jgi:DNA-directed RNA polymerase subunit RPC12/RpoP
MPGKKVSPKDAWQVCPYCGWRTLKLEGVYSPRFLFKGGEHPAVCRHCRGRVVLARRVKYGIRETTITMTLRPVTKKAPKGRQVGRRGRQKRKASARR